MPTLLKRQTRGANRTRALRVDRGEYTRAVTVTPRSIDRENRTLEVVWSTSAIVRRVDYYGNQWDEDLPASNANLARLQNGAAVVDAHRDDSVRYDQVGVSVDAWLENGNRDGVALIKISRSEEKLWQDLEDGIVRNLSIRYKVKRWIDVTSDEDEVPRKRAAAFDVLHLSFVPVNADAGAQTRSEQGSRSSKMPTVRKNVKGKGNRTAGRTDRRRTAERSASTRSSSTRGRRDGAREREREGERNDRDPEELDPNERADDRDTDARASSRDRDDDRGGSTRSRERDDDDRPDDERAEDDDDDARAEDADDDDARAEDDDDARAEDDDDERAEDDDDDERAEDDDDARAEDPDGERSTEDDRDRSRRRGGVPAHRRNLRRSEPAKPRTKADTRAVTILDLCDRTGVSAAFGADLVRKGIPLTAAIGRIRSEWGKRGGTNVRSSGIEVGTDDRTKLNRAVEQSLLYRAYAGRPEMLKKLGVTERALERVGGKDFAGMRMIELGRDYLRRRGIRLVRGAGPQDVADRMLNLDTRSMQTTSDFPNITANVANKTMRLGYTIAPTTWRRFCRFKTVPDFKTNKVTGIGTASRLQPVNEAGIVEKGKLSELGETFAVAPYGVIVPISRQTLINDDLGALTETPQQMAVNAGMLEQDLVISLLIANAGLGVTMADALTLFENGTHANTGTADLSIDGLTEARKKMRQQKTPAPGLQPMNLAPKILLVPTTLETTADQLVTQITPAQFTNANPFLGKLEPPIPEPRLDAIDLDAWIAIADPTLIDTIVVAFIDGNDGPRITTRAGFEVQGVEIKIEHDVGAGVVEYRGFFRSDGSAT